MAKKKNNNGRRRIGRTVSVGAVLPVLRAVKGGIFGNAQWASYKIRRAAGDTPIKAAAHAFDAASHTLTGFDPTSRTGFSGDGRNAFNGTQAATSAGLAVVGPVASRLVRGTPPGRMANRALTYVQRKWLGFRTVVKI